MRDLHMIVLPGGGYRNLADHEAEPVAEWLGSLGCSAEVVRYPVQTRHPAPLDAVRAAVRSARERGAARVGLLGFSAGGHAAGLGALAPGATAEERVDVLVLCYPVTSMRLDTHAGSRAMLLGPAPSDELRASTSLETLVSSDAPPVFVWHTADDATVPVEHSYLLGSALARHGVPHALHVYPSGRHGLGLAREGGDAGVWTRDCAEWLASLDLRDGGGSAR
ncbi:alpha/beta hydrolase [Naasia sp. SYSU D00948]|uniref:alpha/beta hydrolase n=1 Tax=Naasia sp. SYSU D00948 TaxID=2817379 RepID=UPI001B305922|nr:alpha/beta hydrolase [Naasia sp. SYSU D00948]